MSNTSSSNGFLTHKFNFKSGSALSNFSPCSIVVWDQTFSSSEQAYQWYKATDHQFFDIANAILCESNPCKIYKLGKKVKCCVSWQSKKVAVMKHILCVKFDYCQSFREELSTFKDFVLVEDTPNSFWGQGVNGSGKNTLGVLLTEVRFFKNV